MPSVTPADALICVVDNLMDAIAGLPSSNTVTADAVDQLMMIFKQEARDSIDARVLTETQPHAQAPPHPTLQIEDDYKVNAPGPQAIPQITQDDYDSPPAANTR